MAKYLIRALRQLKVGDATRQPGDLVPEAADWPNLRHYEHLAWIERVPVPEDYSGEGAVEYPPPAAQNKLAEVLAPEGKPVEVVVAWPRKKTGSQAIRCLNCRKRNYLPQDFNEQASWMCHSCAPVQSISSAKEHPAPTSLAEFAETISEDYVDDAGDLTDAWKAAVK